MKYKRGKNMQNFNYHTHTYRCGHAQNDMKDEDVVKTFIEEGFDKIAFTDHCPEKEIIDKRKNMRMDYSQLDEYLKSIEYLKNKYKDRIEIETGFEIEYLPGQEENLMELKRLSNKLVLGQHFIYDENNKDLKIFRKCKFSDNDLIKYANYVKKAIELKIPDIIAHPDIYMLSREEFGENEEKVANIICSVAEKYDVPLEINLNEPYMYYTKRKPVVKYPCKGFWKVVSTYNIRVVYGIDAHYLEQIKHFTDSIEVANDIIGKDIIDKLNICDVL